MIEIAPTNENIGARTHAHSPNPAIAAPIPPKDVEIAPNIAIIFGFTLVLSI